MSILRRLIILSSDFETTAAPLTSYQKRKVNGWQKNNPPHSFSDHAMGGEKNDRVVIPVKKHEALAPKHLLNVLGSHGYHEINYSKGLVKDKHGRETKIGKVLIKHGENSALRSYQSDPERAGNEHHEIVISRHPHDVAGMSTNQGWTSCMNMKNGLYKDRLPNEVWHGTHVAYLVKKGDHRAEHPVARIALKKHVSEEGHEILRPESKHYGTANSAFHKTVSAWANKHFKTKDAIYKKDASVYNDDSHEKATIKGKNFNKKFAADKDFADRHYRISTTAQKNKHIQSITDREKLNNLLHRSRPSEISSKTMKHLRKHLL